MTDLLHPTTINAQLGIDMLPVVSDPATEHPNAAVASKAYSPATGDWWTKKSSGWIQDGSSSGGSADWSNITNKPSTRDGYNITDVFTEAESDARYLNVAGDAMSGQLIVGDHLVGYDGETFLWNGIAAPHYGVAWGVPSGNSTPWMMMGGYAGVAMFTAGVERVRIAQDGQFYVFANVNGRDIHADRGDGTGVLYLNNAGNRYLYYNGSSYYFPGAGLIVDGNSSFGGQLSAGSFYTSGMLSCGALSIGGYSPTVIRTGTATTVPSDLQPTQAYWGY